MRRPRIVRDNRPDGSGYTAMEYLVDKFSKFLTNDWVHMERRVARLQGEMFVIIGLLATVLSLLVYLVIRELEFRL